MKHICLFSGIGGFSLAAQLVGGIETTQFVEINPYCQKVLNKNFPNIPIHDDIKTYHPQPGQFDLVTGGSPCQDLSVAGKQRGISGERSSLWFEQLRVFEESRATFLVWENVASSINNGFREVLGSLASNGYDCEWTIIKASDLGFAHLRKRIFLVAYPHGLFKQQQPPPWADQIGDQIAIARNIAARKSSFSCRGRTNDGVSPQLDGSLISHDMDETYCERSWKTAKNSFCKELSMVRLGDGEEEIWGDKEKAGNGACIREQEILRSAVRCESSCSSPAVCALPEKPLSQRELRSLHGQGEITNSSQGCQQGEQSPRKLNDALRFMPPSGTCSYKCGERNIDMFCLRCQNKSNETMLHAPKTTATIRASVENQDKDWCPYLQSCFSCKKFLIGRFNADRGAVSHRLDRLSALGNSVVPQCAAIALQRVLFLDRHFR